MRGRVRIILRLQADGTVGHGIIAGGVQQDAGVIGGHAQAATALRVVQLSRLDQGLRLCRLQHISMIKPKSVWQN